VAFLFDVDNTLLDNDRVKADIAAGIEAAVGSAAAERFWEIYEEVRRAQDYVDYPLTLDRFRDAFPDEPGVDGVFQLVLAYPYRDALYPGALEVLASVQEIGPAAIVTDGDRVYQPAKIATSGLAEAVAGRVFVFSHKEPHLDDVANALLANRYVLVDDKRGVLARAKRLDERLLTVHVRQGHYADADLEASPAPDRTIDRIGDLLDIELPGLLGDGKE
jgi:phosphoglycolate phosphatase-like HAD superfamily hydrolase